MRNILYLSGSDRFPRVRVGVGAQPPEWDLKDWVLSSYHLFFFVSMLSPPYSRSSRP